MFSNDLNKMPLNTSESVNEIFFTKWLNNNPKWHKKVFIHNMDFNTVEKLLRLNKTKFLNKQKIDNHNVKKKFKIDKKTTKIVKKLPINLHYLSLINETKSVNDSYCFIKSNKYLRNQIEYSKENAKVSSVNEKSKEIHDDKNIDMDTDGQKEKNNQNHEVFTDFISYIFKEINLTSLNEKILLTLDSANLGDLEWTSKTEYNIIKLIKFLGCLDITNVHNRKNNENLFQALYNIFGQSICNIFMSNQLEKCKVKKLTGLEDLSSHACCSNEELKSFLSKLPINEEFESINRLIRKDQLSSYIFDDFGLNQDEQIMASYEFFKQLNLINKFKIDKNLLFKWLLTVRKNYRQVTYHNWNHAFNVCQSMYAVFSNSSVSKYFKDIEKLALLVACLSHDLDHRGTNNNFQVESNSPLSQLYGTSSTMEKHHLNCCLSILNSPELKMFSNLKPEAYNLLISLISEAILATDLTDHFSIRAKFQEIVNKKKTNWKDESNKSLLRKNLMTYSDLAGVAKPWPIHKKIVDLVTKEFYEQGNKERIELNKEPNEIMDEKFAYKIPQFQISWINDVCMPLVNNLACLCSSFNGHLDRITENSLRWSLMSDEKSK